MTIESSLLATPLRGDARCSSSRAASCSRCRSRMRGRADAVRHSREHRRRRRQPAGEPGARLPRRARTPTAHVASAPRTAAPAPSAPPTSSTGASVDLKLPFGPDPDDPFIDVDDVMTPSVPVQPSGVTPGPGSLVGEAPFVYVAASGEFPFFPASSTGIDDTIAYKLHVIGGAIEFAVRVPADPEHRPRPGARGQPARDARAREDGEVLDLDHAANLFLATTRDMDLTGEIDFDSALSRRAMTASARRRRRPQARSSTSPTTAGGRSSVASATARPCRPGSSSTTQPTSARPTARRRPAGRLARLRRLRRPGRRLRLPQPRPHAAAGRADRARRRRERLRHGHRRRDRERRARRRSSSSSAPTAARSATDTTPGDGFSLAVDTNALPAGEYVLDAIARDGTLTTLSAPRRVVIRLARRGRAADRRVHEPCRRRAPQRHADARGHRRRRPRRRLRALPGRRARRLHRHGRALRVRLPPDRRRRRPHDARRGGHRRRGPDRRRGADGHRRPLRCRAR